MGFKDDCLIYLAEDTQSPHPLTSVFMAVYPSMPMANSTEASNKGNEVVSAVGSGGED